MGKTRWAALLLAWLVWAPAAHGDGLAALEEQVRAQQRALEALRGRLQVLERHQADASAHAKVEAERGKTRLTLEYRDGFRMEHRDPRTGERRFAFKFGGHIQVDGRVRLTHNDRKLGSSTLNTFRDRRTWLVASGTLYTYWRFVVSLELERDTGVTALTSNYIENTYVDWARIRIGQFPPPYALEPNVRDQHIRLIERAMGSRFFHPLYNVGVMVHGPLADGALNYAVMLANGNENRRQDDDDHKLVWARLLYKPAGDLEGLHLGASGAFGYADRQAPTAEGIGFVATAPGTVIMRYADDVVYDGQGWRAAAEAGYLTGPFGVWGEYLVWRQELARSTFIGELEQVGRREIRWQAAHVTLAYLLTGEAMSFGRVRPLRPLEPGEPDSGYGAFELVGRWDFIAHSLGSDPGVFVSQRDAYRADQLMAGVNWYPNDAVKVALNWQYARWNRRDGELSPRNQHTLLMRVQLEF